MSHHYAPLPNPRTDSQTQRDQEEEMAAAFDYSEDEDDEQDPSETQPLNSNTQSSSTTRTPVAPIASQPHARTAITYDFENVDYDYPPPGSPPSLSSRALPNDIGNSNGHIPSFDGTAQPPRRNWLQRTAAAVLPPRIANKVGLGSQLPSGPVGSGVYNDGVFANVTAKPTLPARVQEGDTHLVPEDAGSDAPPSYQHAQADAVPPYWETTVHAPFSPDSAGEMIIDSLPTGSVFSFLWNMLVSVSFQFVGFLLTYLLHTTHAARLGSRAGLGITLIQYGFALRGKIDTDGNAWVENWRGDPHPTFATGAEADAWYSEHAAAMNTTAGPMPDDQASSFVADATAEWLSFFLMTVGWFILLTSLLGFWRVKRWERGILASQRESNAAAQSSLSHNVAVVSRIEQVFGLRGISRGDLIRQGFGFGGRRSEQEDDESERRAEEGDARFVVQTTNPLPPLDPNDPEGNRVILEAIRHEHRLRTELRNAGLV